MFYFWAKFNRHSIKIKKPARTKNNGPKTSGSCTAIDEVLIVNTTRLCHEGQCSTCSLLILKFRWILEIERAISQNCPRFFWSFAQKRSSNCQLDKHGSRIVTSMSLTTNTFHCTSLTRSFNEFFLRKFGKRRWISPNTFRQTLFQFRHFLLANHLKIIWRRQM